MNVATKKLSFAELKEKANNTSQNDVMEKIQGGSLSDCHGWWGAVGKSMKGGWPSDAIKVLYGVRPQNEGGGIENSGELLELNLML